MLTGPDASHHNGIIDWSQVRAAGHTYAFIKATEGTAYSHVDWFHQNWPRLKMSGLVPGAYHFLRSDFDPVAQARYFVATVGSFAGALAVVDVETGTKGSTPTDVHTRAFATEFHRLVPGHPLVVYTGRWYWRDTIGNPTGVDIGRLWHSAYSATPGAMYGKWQAPTFWQWTSSGSCPGISGNCDLNEFHGGGRPELLALTSDQEDDVTTPEQMDELVHRISAEVYNRLQAALPKLAAFLVTGARNTVIQPDEWNDPATAANLNEILAAAKGAPTGPGDPTSPEEIEAALRRVFADAGQA